MVQLTFEQCEKLFNINALLTQSLDKQTVLQNLLKAAMDLIDRADTIIIYEKNDDGYITFSDGIGVEIAPIRKVKFRPGESITGRAYLEKRIYNVSRDTAKRYMGNMSEDNKKFFQQAVKNRQVESVLAAPLVYQNECIGVLVVDNFDIPGDKFTEEETLIIEILANQAAIALTNSRFYTELQRRNNDLLAIQKIHETFSNILLEGKGINQITEVLSRILSQNVTYVETLHMQDEESVFPIISSNETLGYFQLPKPLASYTNVEKVALEQAANAVVLELIKQNNLFERKNKLQEELFQKLLDGLWDDQLEHYHKFNRLTKFQSVACVLLEGKKEPLWNEHSLVAKERVMRRVEQAFFANYEEVVVFNRGFTIYILLPNIKRLKTNDFHVMLQEVFPNQEVVVGIGRTVPVKQIANSHQEANDALQLAKKSKDRSIILYEDLGFERLWHGTDESTLTQYVTDQISPLLNGDPVDLETLQTYIELNGKHKETAEKLCIHPNTLAYRLRKIENLLNIDLKNQQDLLKVMTAFNILEYLPNNTL